MTPIRTWTIRCFTAGLLALAASAAAQVHGEMGDAPASLFGQITYSTGALLRIHGTIADSADVDVYCVAVANPAAFSATVVGTAGFDTQLFLFKGPPAGCTIPPCPPLGTGVTTNDDTPPGVDNLQSTITGALLPAEFSAYALAISAFGRVPTSAGGLIWSGFPANAEYAPDGPGAASALSGWTDFGGASGEYWILLTGCEACNQEEQAGTWFESGDAPDDLAGQPTTGDGPILRVFGDLSDGSDVDGYRIRINDPAGFSAVSSGALNQDTELSLFAARDGNGVAFDDDAPATLLSRLSGASITDPGIHMLYISKYDRMASSSGGGIWAPLPANVERAPDGPGAPGQLASWIGAGGFEGGYYGIQLTGAEFANTTDAVPMRPLRALDLKVYPNPFRSSAEMRYSLTTAARVDLVVFDLSGRVVRRIVKGQQLPGEHTVHWDGRDASGRPAPTGVYSVHLESPGTQSVTRRAVLIR